ncbi:Sad1/UNC domain-containing protein [Purpureocillium lavendulum]|uniref:Sad1/UNC domain-containing protein n=1 Tax=Purpureocillium lavendulum TaxID=1247861 RepID=A0AB34FMD7_9HYPO|nr:Sad1/UNC domain-containing protein [Purpureocillium lavendulum]
MSPAHQTMDDEWPPPAGAFGDDNPAAPGGPASATAPAAGSGLDGINGHVNMNVNADMDMNMDMNLPWLDDTLATMAADQDARFVSPAATMTTATPPVTAAASSSRSCRPLFTQDAVRTLRRWFAANKHHPYPTRDDKEALCALTGLDATQVANWFANARRRRIKVGSPPPPASSVAASRFMTGPLVAPVPVAPTHDASPLRHEAATPPVDVPLPPRRAPTPGIFEDMDPLQRWANSPPEDEPAEATAICRAANEPFYAGPSSRAYSAYAYLSDGEGGGGGSSASASNRSSVSRHDNPSSEGSIASSRSSSFGMPPSPLELAASHHHRRRRRRRKHQSLPQRQALSRPSRGIFQCTFCVEEFRTKYDWQRHEKTWHLPLDRWVCTPTGPLALKRHSLNDHDDASKSAGERSGGRDTLVCVFCGDESPDAAHIESHNFSLCNRRGVDERTFYRRDHLMQHLRLVHGVVHGVPGAAFDEWKAAAPPIRSRCGFCGRCLDDWAMRVEHLAEHFKGGSTMRDWVGDWGFDPAILQTIENSMPPYLLDYERNSPLPYKAGGASPWTPSTAYDLLKMELQYWIMNHLDAAGDQPPDSEIQREACRVILSADLAGAASAATTTAGNSHKQGSSSGGRSGTSPSWLRDLATASPEILQGAMLQTVRGQAENRLTTLRINGKDDIFEGCELERQLRAVCARAARLRQGEFLDREVQAEAARIVRQTEERSSAPSDVVAGWLLRMIYASTDWLDGVRRRAAAIAGDTGNDDDGEGDAGAGAAGAAVALPVGGTAPGLELELAGMGGAQMNALSGAQGPVSQLAGEGIVAPTAVFPPLAPFSGTEADLLWALDLPGDGAPAPMVYATATPPHEDEESRLYQLNMSRNTRTTTTTTALTTNTTATTTAAAAAARGALASTTTTSRSSPAAGSNSSATAADGQQQQHTQLAAAVAASTRPPYFPNDANAYRRLAHDLARFVAAAVSDKNPNRHVPSDEEIQYQARWLEFDDDDPWNQTAADNPEWLMRFKRDVGLLPHDSGPGLGLGYFAWQR